MILEQLCPPALLYVGFSLTQIIIDIFKKMYNTAFFKLIVTFIFTMLLNILCKQGLGVVSWFIVFVPFIMMSIITTLLLFVFGLSPFTGKLNYNVDYQDNSQTNDQQTTHQKKHTNHMLKGSNYNPYEARAKAYEKAHPDALKKATEEQALIKQRDLAKWHKQNPTNY